MQTNVTLDIQTTNPCNGCTFLQEHCLREARNLRSQQYQRYRCIYATAHGGVFAKDAGDVMVKFAFRPDEQNRLDKLDVEVDKAIDFLYNNNFQNIN